MRLLRAAAIAALAWLLSPALGQCQTEATPAPEATPTIAPIDFTYGGHVRAFFFTRQNCSGYPSNPCVLNTSSTIPGTYKSLNQAAFNAAILLHGDYRFEKAGWSIGATYINANDFGGNGYCGTPGNYAQDAPCSQYPPNNNYESTDTTLPAFTLNTLSEAYLQYRSKQLRALAGLQLYDTPWAGPSDSRIKAAYYQGIDARYDLSKAWSVRASRITQWQDRVSSNFNKSHLIVPLAPDGAIANPTTGFLLLSAGYKPDARFGADAYYYEFYDVASLIWIEAHWRPEAGSPLRPTLGVQFAREKNIGTSLVGIVDSAVIGAQVGVGFGPNVDVEFDYDHIPLRSVDVTLPKGIECKKDVISGSGPTGETGYWLPTGGTPNCVPIGSSSATVYYGGVASPYTDSYSTSPLFTTNMSQDVVERRSPGDSLKLEATIHGFDRRLTVILARVLDEYANPAGASATWGTSIDAEYRFNPVGKGKYRGFSLRDRWMQRTQSYTELWGGTPLFVYNRVQLEFDF